MRTKQDLMRDGECVNGDGRPISPPSAVLCRECLRGLTVKMENLRSLFDPTPPEGGK